MLPKLTLQKTVPISDSNPAATLEVYARAGAAGKPAMLVFPGGAMRFLSPAEAEPICRYYDAHGYQTFLVNYTVGGACKYPDLLHEVSRAVWEVRCNAADYGVDPARIVLNGFSAGAHVVTMFATHYHLPISREGTGVPEGGNAVCATVTGYTPTTFEDFGQNLDKMPPEIRAKMEEGIKKPYRRRLGAAGCARQLFRRHSLPDLPQGRQRDDAARVFVADHPGRPRQRLGVRHGPEKIPHRV